MYNLGIMIHTFDIQTILAKLMHHRRACMHATYNLHQCIQSCLAVISKKIGPPPNTEALYPVRGQKKIHWLHLPKCGSSFGAVLVRTLFTHDASAW